MSRDLTIAISGKSGCGNSTVSRMVAEALGLRLVNYTFRSVADELGMDFEEVRRLAEHDFSYDRMVDRRQVELASRGGCVLGSRLAIWLLPDADFRVYLTASIDKRSDRIWKREGGDYDSVKEATAARDAADKARYRRLYDIDIDDYGFADLIVDTEEINQHEVSQHVLSFVAESFPSP